MGKSGADPGFSNWEGGGGGVTDDYVHSSHIMSTKREVSYGLGFRRLISHAI